MPCLLCFPYQSSRQLTSLNATVTSEELAEVVKKRTISQIPRAKWSALLHS